jgi:hypothetical protein
MADLIPFQTHYFSDNLVVPASNPDLRICSQDLWWLNHRGGLVRPHTRGQKKLICMWILQQARNEMTNWHIHIPTEMRWSHFCEIISSPLEGSGKGQYWELIVYRQSYLILSWRQRKGTILRVNCLQEVISYSLLKAVERDNTES